MCLPCGLLATEIDELIDDSRQSELDRAGLVELFEQTSERVVGSVRLAVGAWKRPQTRWPRAAQPTRTACHRCRFQLSCIDSQQVHGYR
jgi:hypothetical protein